MRSWCERQRASKHSLGFSETRGCLGPDILDLSKSASSEENSRSKDTVENHHTLGFQYRQVYEKQHWILRRQGVTAKASFPSTTTGAFDGFTNCFAAAQKPGWLTLANPLLSLTTWVFRFCSLWIPDWRVQLKSLSWMCLAVLLLAYYPFAQRRNAFFWPLELLRVCLVFGFPLFRPSRLSFVELPTLWSVVAHTSRVSAALSLAHIHLWWNPFVTCWLKSLPMTRGSWFSFSPYYLVLNISALKQKF